LGESGGKGKGVLSDEIFDVEGVKTENKSAQDRNLKQTKASYKERVN